MKTLSIGGMGGFELGLQNAGVEVQPVAFCEREARAREVLRRHWPSALTYDTISGIRNAGYKRRSIDIICGKLGGRTKDEPGGPFVLAGEHQRVAAIAGRGDELARLIRTLEPEWAIVEIERGILAANGGSRFQSFLAQIAGWLPGIPAGGYRTAGAIKPIAAAGGARYGAAWRVLDLRCFGATFEGIGVIPQQRQRCYVVLRRGEAPGIEVLLDEEDLVGIFGSMDESGKREADAGVDVPPCNPPACGGTEGGDGARMIPFVWRAGGFNASPIVDRDTLPTISGDNVALADPATRTVRRLTPEECELAYTLPNGCTARGVRSTAEGLAPTAIADAPRYRMLGRDTVPPAIIEWIGRRMIAHA